MPVRLSVCNRHIIFRRQILSFSSCSTESICQLLPSNTALVSRGRKCSDTKMAARVLEGHTASGKMQRKGGKGKSPFRMGEERHDLKVRNIDLHSCPVFVPVTTINEDCSGSTQDTSSGLCATCAFLKGFCLDPALMSAHYVRARLIIGMWR